MPRSRPGWPNNWLQQMIRPRSSSIQPLTIRRSSAVDTLNLFVSVLGAEAGNVALKVLAMGGVYLGGGILPRIIPVLKKGPFMEAFCRKGRLSVLMSRIPVYCILNPQITLISAAFQGLELFSG